MGGEVLNEYVKPSYVGGAEWAVRLTGGRSAGIVGSVCADVASKDEHCQLMVVVVIGA
jgi:hypothetical protein